MISSETIQVYEGDGVNPRWKGLLYGDGIGFVSLQQKTDYSDMDGARDRNGGGEGKGNGTDTGNGYGNGYGNCHGDGVGDNFFSNLNGSTPGLQE